ncbi:hypothetical protein [Pelagibius sp.]|uniref:hypothetical protein n=2 Tax=Pelagibius sp. TaxID=1931238 RepID=UPI003BB0343B
MLSKGLMAVLLGAAAVLAVGLLIVFDSLAVRASGLGHSQHCLHGLLTGAAREAKVLVIGSSRTRQAIDPSQLARFWRLPESAVVSLAHPGRSFRLDAHWVELLTREKGIELVIMEAQVGSAATRRLEQRIDPARLERHDLQLASGRYREFYATAASYRDLLGSVAESSQTALLQAYDSSRLLLRKLDRSTKLLATRQVQKTLYRPDPAIDYSRRNICFLASGNDPDRQNGTPRQQEKKRLFAEAFHAANPDGWAAAAPDAPDFLLDPERAPDRLVFGRLAELSQERGFALAYVYMPSIFVPPPDDAFAARFERSLNAPLFLPPRGLLADLQADGYYDNSHLNLKGIRQFTDWLSDAMRARGVLHHGG